MKGSCQPQVSRRNSVRSAALAGVALAAPTSRQSAQQPLPALTRPDGPPGIVASDEAFWSRVAAHYEGSDRITNLEAGYWGIMAVPVLAEYVRNLESVNVASSYYARGDYLVDLQTARTRVAAALGVEVDEIAFTRGATEALQSSSAVITPQTWGYGVVCRRRLPRHAIPDEVAGRSPWRARCSG